MDQEPCGRRFHIHILLDNCPDDEWNRWLLEEVFLGKGSGMADHKKIGLDLQVRFRDVDSMGHVNNAVFLTYFEEGRKAFMERVLGIVEPSEYFFILAKIECEYLNALKLGRDIRIELWVGRVGGKSFTFSYEIFDKERPDLKYARGQSVQVFFDYRENKTMEAPENFVEKVSEYLEA